MLLRAGSLRLKHREGVFVLEHRLAARMNQLHSIKLFQLVEETVQGGGNPCSFVSISSFLRVGSPSKVTRWSYRLILNPNRLSARLSAS